MDNLISRETMKDAIDSTTWYHRRNGFMVEGAADKKTAWYKAEDVYKAIENVPSAQPNLQPTCNQLATDCISRQDAIDALAYFTEKSPTGRTAQEVVKALPSVQPEPLTDKEQRIFLAAMTREEKVCKEVDAEMSGEQYEEILVRVCREIVRKVKGALWT